MFSAIFFLLSSKQSVDKLHFTGELSEEMFSSTRTSLSFISSRCTSKISSIWALVSNDLSCFLTGVEVPFILLKFGDDIE